MNRLKSIIKEFIEEKNKKALEEQLRQQEQQERRILTKCSNEFVEALKDTPDEFNIKKSLSAVSLTVKFYKNNFFVIRIPKADSMQELRPPQKVALGKELQERINHLRSEAELMVQEFRRQTDFEHNIISEKCYYSGNNKEVMEFESQARINEQQLYQAIHFRFWKYGIEKVWDSANSLYITVLFSLNIPNEWY